MLNFRFLLLSDFFPSEEVGSNAPITHCPDRGEGSNILPALADRGCFHPNFKREWQNAGNIVNPRVRTERVAGLYLLSSLLCEVGIPPEQYALCREENGRPYLAFDGAPDFSISHDGGGVLCVLSDSRVGADLTALSTLPPTPRCLSLAVRYFSSTEQEELTAVSDETECRRRFARIWARREAYAKYTGVGLPDALRQRDPREEPVLFCSLPVPFAAEAIVCRNRQE